MIKKITLFFKKSILSILKCKVRFIVYLFSRSFINNGEEYLLDYICDYLDFYNKGYLSFYNWPKDVSKIIKLDDVDHVVERDKDAILLTGLIINKDEFTTNTIELYRYLYPETEIIVSTWNSEKNKINNYFDNDNKVHFVFSDEPPVCGCGNINFQLVTARKALEKANELRVKNILKSRCDMRIYRRNIMDYLYVTINDYKPKSFSQKNRIVTMSGRNNTMDLYYVLCDLFVYGNISDVAKLYSADFDLCLDDFKKMSYKERTKHCKTAESYLFKNYLDNYIDDKVYETKKDDVISAVRDNFIIIDEEFLQMYWAGRKKGFNYFDEKHIFDNTGNNFDYLNWKIYNSK